MVELVSLGIERYQTWLTHALGQFEFHHAPRIAFFLYVLFHFGGEFYIKIRCIQLRITLATLDVVPKRAVGILRQPDAGRSFKLNPLENGFQSKYGGFVAIKQPPDTQFT